LTLALVGGPVYFGKHTDLINGSRYELVHQDQVMKSVYLGSLQNMESRHVPRTVDPGNYTILVPSHIYTAWTTERKASEEVGPGVFRLKSSTRPESNIHSEQSKPLETDSIQHWQAFTHDIQITLDPSEKVNGMSVMNIQVNNTDDSTKYVHLVNAHRWNFSQVKFIEFDIRVKDGIENLQKTNWYLVAQANPTFTDYFHIEYTDKVLDPNGWNHIMIPLADLETTGSPSLDNIHYLSFGIWSEHHNIRFNINNITTSN
jgi:hypothetical protein